MMPLGLVRGNFTGQLGMGCPDRASNTMGRASWVGKSECHWGIPAEGAKEVAGSHPTSSLDSLAGATRVSFLLGYSFMGQNRAWGGCWLHSQGALRVQGRFRGGHGDGRRPSKGQRFERGKLFRNGLKLWRGHARTHTLCIDLDRSTVSRSIS